MVDSASDDFSGEEVDGCRSCHVINPESDSAAAYESIVLANFDSDFHDLDKGRCSDCHTQEQALTDCTLCHNYHVGERGLSGIQASHPSPASRLASDELAQSVRNAEVVENDEITLATVSKDERTDMPASPSEAALQKE
jgi:hypothetical protein